MKDEKLKKIDAIRTKPSKLHPAIYALFAIVLGFIISEFFRIDFVPALLFGILAVIFFTFLDHLLMPDTKPCPYCGENIKVKIDWHCDHCHNSQGKKRFLSENCLHCNQLLDTAVCVHCRKKFKI